MLEWVLGFDANTVGEYILLSVLLHVFAVTACTWDISIKCTEASGK